MKLKGTLLMIALSLMSLSAYAANQVIKEDLTPPAPEGAITAGQIPPLYNADAQKALMNAKPQDQTNNTTSPQMMQQTANPVQPMIQSSVPAQAAPLQMQQQPATQMPAQPGQQPAAGQIPGQQVQQQSGAPAQTQQSGIQIQSPAPNAAPAQSQQPMAPQNTTSPQ